MSSMKSHKVKLASFYDQNELEEHKLTEVLAKKTSLIENGTLKSQSIVLIHNKETNVDSKDEARFFFI